MVYRHGPSGGRFKEIMLERILAALEMSDYPVIFPVHPRIRKYVENINGKRHCQNICFVEPLGYLVMFFFTRNAIKVVTDSGGLQKEAYMLHRNVVTLREQTEWMETMSGNHNTLCPIDAKKIIEAVQRTDIDRTFDNSLYGDGNAACRLCQIIFD